MDKIFLSLERNEIKSAIKEAFVEILDEREYSNENTLINVQESGCVVESCG